MADNTVSASSKAIEELFFYAAAKAVPSPFNKQFAVNRRVQCWHGQSSRSYERQCY